MSNTFCELRLIGNLVLVNLSINLGNILFTCVLYRSYINNSCYHAPLSEYFENRLPPYRSKRGMVEEWD